MKEVIYKINTKCDTAVTQKGTDVYQVSNRSICIHNYIFETLNSVSGILILNFINQQKYL